MRVKPYRVFFRQISTAATRLQNGLINPTDSDQFTAPAAPRQTTDYSDISDRLRPNAFVAHMTVLAHGKLKEN